ncbi:MAG: RNA polymerase sigma factor [Pseudomonadota bacterium]
MAKDERVDRDGLLAFFLAEIPGLRRYFSARLGGVAEIDDLAQEAWLRLERNALQAEKAPGPYLRRIAASVVVDFSRKRPVAREVPLSAAADVADGAAGPEDLALWRSEVALLRQALADMPQRRRDIFILVSLRGQPRQEVARRFGISRRTVEAELRMALDHCAERLGAGR